MSFPIQLDDVWCCGDGIEWRVMAANRTLGNYGIGWLIERANKPTTPVAILKRIVDDQGQSTWLCHAPSKPLVALLSRPHYGDNGTAFKLTAPRPLLCLRHDPVDTGMRTSWCRTCDQTLQLVDLEWKETL